MFNSYKLVTLTLNTKGGDSQTIEALTKEVDGKVVPCTLSEAKLKLSSKLATVGGNPATQGIKCILLDSNGGFVKDDDVFKEIETPKVEAKAEAKTETPTEAPTEE